MQFASQILSENWFQSGENSMPDGYVVRMTFLIHINVILSSKIRSVTFRTVDHKQFLPHTKQILDVGKPLEIVVSSWQ